MVWGPKSWADPAKLALNAPPVWTAPPRGQGGFSLDSVPVFLPNAEKSTGIIQALRDGVPATVVTGQI